MQAGVEHTGGGSMAEGVAQCRVSGIGGFGPFVPYVLGGARSPRC